MNMQQITKYQHACLVVTKDDSSLVIDPGAWSGDFVSPSKVAGVVITHEHQDHFDRTKLKAIADANPDAIVYAPKAVTKQLEDIKSQAVSANETIQVGPFTLSFFGGEHAVIDVAMPVAANLGVLVDGSLYYPGDSFTIPNMTIKTLALPVSAPWLKFSEAAAFLRAMEPSEVFPTHDAILSEEGKALADMMFGAACSKIGATYTRLDI